MPIYAYRCEHCGHAKDVLQKLSDPVLTECPACGEPTFRKQVTAAGFQLKGSGWYVTDFKGDKPAGKAVDADPKTDSNDGDAKRADGKTGDATATESPKTNGSPDGGKSATSEPSVSAPSTAAPAPAAAPAAGSGGPAPGRQP
jgi:putative FmdB family regulatory protein